MPMTHLSEIGAENRYQKKIRYQIACQTSQKPVSLFWLVPVFGADFWYVCQWHDIAELQRASKQRHKENTPTNAPGLQHPSLLSYVGRLGSGVWSTDPFSKKFLDGFCPTTAKRRLWLSWQPIILFRCLTSCQSANIATAPPLIFGREKM